MMKEQKHAPGRVDTGNKKLGEEVSLALFDENVKPVVEPPLPLPDFA